MNRCENCGRETGDRECPVHGAGYLSAKTWLWGAAAFMALFVLGCMGIVHGAEAPTKLTDAERFDLMSLRDDAHAADGALAHAVSQCGTAALREINEDQAKSQTATKAFSDALAAFQKKVGDACKLDDKFQCAAK